MWKIRIIAIIIILAGFGIGYFDYQSEVAKNIELEIPTINLSSDNFDPETGEVILDDLASIIPEKSKLEKYAFKLGLDLSGGVHLVYRADTSSVVDESQIEDSMSALRDVIERRVNLFGVSEPVVQIEKSSPLSSGPRENRLIIELPGLTDVDLAISMIGQTPLLEFKKERPDGQSSEILEAQFNGQRLDEDAFIDSGLTGRYLKRAQMEFNNTTGEPVVTVTFDKEGSDLFEEITEENIGKSLAIYLDGAPISIPVVREKIDGGVAVISGNFKPEEAKVLVGRLNSGALPIPIELISTQVIGPTLGAEAFDAGVKAGFWGLILVAIFLILWYRLPGVLAVVSLSFYVVAILAIFKIIPVTLTAAGVAGFILSIGMAVDANVLIFERMKEERRSGRGLYDSIKEGFARAWLSIRDANISSLITAVILFWFGSSLIEGFALTFGIGVLVSMITAITITRTFLYAVASSSSKGENRFIKFLFGSGLN